MLADYILIFLFFLFIQVVLDDMGNKIVYEFPVGRWFAIDEDDGKIQRDFLVGGNQPTGEKYVYEPGKNALHTLHVSENNHGKDEN